MTYFRSTTFPSTCCKNKVFQDEIEVTVLVERFLDFSHSSEIRFRCTPFDRGILNFVLFRQIIQWAEHLSIRFTVIEKVLPDGLLQTRHSKKCGEISSVRGDDNKTEQPPGRSHQATGNVFWSFPTTWNPRNERWNTVILFLYILFDTQKYK